VSTGNRQSDQTVTIKFRWPPKGWQNLANWRSPRSFINLDFINLNCSKSKSHYNWRSVSQSVYQGIEPNLLLVTRYYFLSEGCFLKVIVLSLWGALSDERSGLSFVILSLVIYQYLHKAFTLHFFYSSTIYIQYIQSFIQSRPSTADYALLVIISSNYCNYPSSCLLFKTELYRFVRTWQETHYVSSASPTG
jgi:hypothetical protein